MPKETTKKNTKGTKKVTTKKPTSKKVQPKTTVKKVEPKVKEAKKVVEKKATKKVVEKKTMKGKVLINKVLDNTPLVVALCVILVLLAALIFTLCVKRVPKTSEGNEILATIKGETITADDLYEQLKSEYGTNSLIDLIDTYIADKEVTITTEDEEYVKEMVDYYKEYAEYYQVDLATFLSSYMNLSGITTEEQFYNFLLEDYKKSLVLVNYLSEEAKEEDLKNYYKENYSDSLTVKHILIEVDKEADDEKEADKEAYNKAVKLIKKLKDTDKDDLDDKFEELAKENSDDTATYSNGGLMEGFTKKDVVEEFFEASNELKNGEYTLEPVKTTYGYHIILKVSSTPVEKYKEIKAEVAKAYAQNLLSSDANLQITKWDELRNKYKLSIKDDFIKKAYKETLKNALNQNKTEE